MFTNTKKYSLVLNLLFSAICLLMFGGAYAYLDGDGISCEQCSNFYNQLEQLNNHAYSSTQIQNNNTIPIQGNHVINDVGNTIKDAVNKWIALTIYQNPNSYQDPSQTIKLNAYGESFVKDIVKGKYYTELQETIEKLDQLRTQIGAVCEVTSYEDPYGVRADYFRNYLITALDLIIRRTIYHQQTRARIFKYCTISPQECYTFISPQEYYTLTLALNFITYSIVDHNARNIAASNMVTKNCGSGVCMKKLNEDIKLYKDKCRGLDKLIFMVAHEWIMFIENNKSECGCIYINSINGYQCIHTSNLVTFKYQIPYQYVNLPFLN